MIEGMVTDNLEAVVSVVLHGNEGRTLRVDCALDTGFTEHLTVPPSFAESLGWEATVSSTATLADGQKVEIPVCLGQLEWDGRRLYVMALVAEGAPLLGMALMENFRLEVEVVPDGKVRLSRLM